MFNLWPNICKNKAVYGYFATIFFSVQVVHLKINDNYKLEFEMPISKDFHLKLKVKLFRTSKAFMLKRKEHNCSNKLELFLNCFVLFYSSSN